jgi:hypothetical protein
MRHSAFQRKQTRRPLWARRPAGLVEFSPSVPRGRRPTSIRGLKRRARILKLGLLAAIVVVLGGGVALADAYYQSFRVYHDVKGVMPRLASATDDLAQGKLPPGDELGAASRMADTARRRMDDARFTFRLSSVIPFFGRPVRAVQHGVAAAEQEARAATLMNDIVLEALGDSALPEGGDDSTPQDPPLFRRERVNVRLMASLTGRLEAMVGHLRAADREIRAIPSLPFLGHLDRLKADALDGSAKAIRMGEEALAGARLLPSFLGGAGDRTYLLALQDGSRQRATGGTVVAYALVTADRGTLALLRGGPIEAIDDPAGLPNIALPPSLSWFLENVEGLPAQPRLGDINLSPDFPAAARAWSSLLEEATGRRVDGVIALDAVAVSYLLGEGAMRVPSFGDAITGENAVEAITNDSYNLPPLRRQAFVAAVLAGTWELISRADPLVPSVKRLGRGLREKHIQMWSTDPNEQLHMDRLGWDGGLDAGTGDFLYVTDNALLSTRVDYYSYLTIVYDVVVKADGAIQSSSRIGLSNESPEGLPPAIAGRRGPRYALNRALIGLYAPVRARLESSEPAEALPSHVEGRTRVFMAAISVRPDRARAVRFDYSVPGVIRSNDGRKVYRLTVQHQPLLNPAELTVNVRLPDDAVVLSAPGWTVNGNEATLKVVLTRDLVTEITF